MKGMVLERQSDIREAPLGLHDFPLPMPGVGELRIKVHCCGICRTDLHIIEGELPARRLPLIPGHQVVGTVDLLGPGVKRLREGQRVGIAWLRKTCGHCSYCRSNRENLCEASLFTGYHEHGGFAEYAVIAEDYAYELPDAMSDAEAAPLLCAGIIGYRALQRAQLPERGKLAIFGFGSSAHIVAQIAKARGSEVYVVTRGENHQELARTLGVNWVGGPDDAVPERVDSAIVFAPEGKIVPVALEALKKGGTLSLAGIYMSPIPPLDYERHVFYEKNIHSVTANTRDDGKALLHIAAEIPIRARVTLYRLEDANRALLDLKSDRISGTGVLQLL